MRNAQIPFWVSYFTRETKSWSYQKEKTSEKEQFLRACRKPWAGWEAILFLLVPQFGLGLVPCFGFAPLSRGFHEKGTDPPKKTRNAHGEAQAVPSHTGESESQVRQGLTKKSAMSSWLLSMAKNLFLNKYLPFWSLTANILKSYQNPIGGLSSNFQPSFFRGELLNFGVYMQISCASIPTDKKLARDKSWSHDDFGPCSNGELKKTGGPQFHLCWIDGTPFFSQIYPKFPVQFS